MCPTEGNPHLLSICLVPFSMFGSLERIVLLKDGFALVFCRKKQRGREDI